MNKPNVLSENKEYKLKDYVVVPFRIAPFQMSVILLNKLLSAVVPSLQVLVIAQFIDTAGGIFQGNMPRNAVYLPLFLLMLMVAYSYLNWSVMGIMNGQADMRMKKVLNMQMLWKRAALEYQYIEDNDTWNLISRTCENPAASMLKGFHAVFGIAEIICRIMCIIAIFISQVFWSSHIIIVMLVPLLLLAYKSGRSAYFTSVEAAKLTRRAVYLHKVLSERNTMNERTLFGYTDNLNKRWLEKYEAARKMKLKTEIRNYVRMKGASIITVCISAAIVLVLLYPVSEGTLTVGLFMGLVSAAFNLVQMMSWTLANSIKQLVVHKEYLKDLTAVMGLKTVPGSLSDREKLDEFSLDSIEFRNVSFHYPGTDRYVLKNLSFVLRKGKTYAFVGANGAGKTTVTKLLTGLYDQYEGEIYINGKISQSYSPAQRKWIFSVVYQDFCKYAISIRDNISLGTIESFSEQQAAEILDKLGMLERINQFPEKMNTLLGKIAGDADLSGGEWQRLALARVLYADAPVYILDEPTAALDPIAESDIYSLFHEISKNKTTIFITHRMGAAKIADEIMVMDGGRIAESGSHKELIDCKGIYYNMYESQKEWYEYEE